jgi:hypothetical protein
MKRGGMSDAVTQCTYLSEAPRQGEKKEGRQVAYDIARRNTTGHGRRTERVAMPDRSELVYNVT